ncbi:MAG: energy-coupling factor ABC transporter permease [Nitrospirae bacterium]|nr:energy-coupling factor ABC transporter permease [Nitrospirota bacterium]
MKIQNITRHLLFITFLLVTCHLSLVTEANAMHISEGILPLNWAALWFALSVPFVAYGIKRLKDISKIDLSYKPLVGLMTAVVFVISLMPIPVPTAGTCSHPGGTAIPAILLGPSITVLITGVALLIQALFFAHGGLSTWGADVVSMGVMGAFVGLGVFRLLRRFNISLAISAFFAGLLSDWAIYLTTSVELAAGIRGNEPFMPLFAKIAIAFIPTQLPLGIVEGVMTAGMITLLYKRRSDLLVKFGVIKAEEAIS